MCRCVQSTHNYFNATDLVRNQTNSYWQLPLMLYQIKLKFPDEPRPRAGLICVHEFAMKDAYSFHADEADVDRYYAEMHQIYFHGRCVQIKPKHLSIEYSRWVP